MSNVDPNHIDFIAYTLYVEDVRFGHVWTRWWCLDETLREQYRAEARTRFAAWCAEERRAHELIEVSTKLPL